MVATKTRPFREPLSEKTYIVWSVVVAVCIEEDGKTVEEVHVPKYRS